MRDSRETEVFDEIIEKKWWKEGRGDERVMVRIAK